MSDAAPSPAFLIVSQMAFDEAKTAGFGGVHPEHYAIAIFKFAELPPNPKGLDSDQRAMFQQIETSVRAVRKILSGRSIDPKNARRRLIEKLGDGGMRDVALRDNQEAEACIYRANSLARQDGALRPEHLLKVLLDSPTPLLREALEARPLRQGAADPPMKSLTKAANQSRSPGCLTLVLICTGTFVGLKLSGKIDWSWVWVFSPLWIYFSIVASLLVLLVWLRVRLAQS